MKPIIGIVEWPYLDKDEDKIYEIRNEVVEWIIRSGGRPIGIFPTQIENYVNTRLRDIPQMSTKELYDLKETVKMCDAIIKPGALKIYHHEQEIYKYVVEEDIPYMGICAGMQLMANYNTPNIRNERNAGFIEHHSNDSYAHKIHVNKGTKLYDILKKDEIMVNSLHNYHIPTTELQIGAVSEDEIIEEIENPNLSFNLGFQWHPELLPKEDENSQIIFGEFVGAAKKYQKRKAKN